MKYFNLLNWSALVLALLIVFLSTHIRLGEAGLGCEPWPGCYAQLPLVTDVKGLQVPDTDFKVYRSLHRYVATVLGIMVLAIVLVALFNRRTISPGLSSLMLAVVIFLSVIGVMTPSRSLPIVTFSNILGGIVLAGLVWRQILRGQPRKPVKGHFVILLLSLTVTLQLISGAWASANYTGSACPGLLTCTHTEDVSAHLASSFNPLRSLSLDQNYRLVLDTTATIIQFTHRLLAVVLLIVALVAYWLIKRRYPELHRPMAVVLGILLAEVVLGVINVSMDMPLWTNTLHNLLAVVLLFAVINLTMLTKRTKAAWLNAVFPSSP